MVSRKLDAQNPSDAIRAMERLRASALKPGALPVTHQRLTVARLAEMFLAAVDADASYSPRYRESLHERIEVHVLPALGRVAVSKIDVFAARTWARGLPTPLAAKTHLNIVSAASPMFAWAVTEGYAPENAIQRARERFPRDLPRTGNTKPSRTLTDQELEASLAELGETYRPVIVYIGETGARVSEALGMRFCDIDPQAKTGRRTTRDGRRVPSGRRRRPARWLPSRCRGCGRDRA
jgi:integrase